MNKQFKTIIQILKEKYDPVSIILYGSFADGSNSANSDLDALVISNGEKSAHDVSIQSWVQLDVFVKPKSSFVNFKPEEYLQIFDGIVIFDSNDYGLGIINRVNQYINAIPKKTADEKKEEIEWCKKMLLRTQRSDTEGMYRWHWLLVDSLEIYFDLIEQVYHGPKKALLWIKNTSRLHIPSLIPLLEKWMPHH